MAHSVGSLNLMPAKNSRFVVGIDLGTTNSAVSYVDSHDTNITIRNFAIEQEIAVGEISSNEVLPSFIYYPTKGDVSVGVLARKQSALTPGRVISSAKSWLCHDGVDRTAAILPWHGAEDITPLSPVKAITTILKHIVNQWNQVFVDYPLCEQDIVITVPASFDDMARSLTVKAAALAGIENPVLLEEPQAAFYAWLERNQASWQDVLKANQVVLVCDIGGGTSDFSLISIAEEKDAKLGFKREAVGAHLLLGGDNLDLSIAHSAELAMRLNEKLSPRDWGMLVAGSQDAKEQFFSAVPPDELVINLAGSGRSLVGGSRQIKLYREEITQNIIEGFMPLVSLNEKPKNVNSGFKEFGLPYVSDSAITKHLASFLVKNLQDRAPDVILFNGGFFESKLFRDRILLALKHWYNCNIPSLHVPRLDLAVSQGAASYAMVRRGWGQRIGGGLAHSTFIEVADKNNQSKALSIAPAGMSEGQNYLIDTLPMHLKINQPVQFGLFSSKTNQVVPAGTLIAVEGLKRCNPLRSLLKIGKKKKRATEVDVILESKLSAIGILELWCREIEGNRKWRLEFDPKAILDVENNKDNIALQGCTDSQLNQAELIIKNAFLGNNDPDKILKLLEDITNQERWQWNLIVLRQFFNLVFENRDGRKRSAKHEMRWLYLAGFCLRPGFGVDIDDWRIKQMWEVFHSGVIHHRNQQCMSDWWLLFNRIAGGLNSGQQRELAKKPLANFKASLLNKKTGKMKHHEAGEFWRLIGSLERLEPSLKLELMEIILKIIQKDGVGTARGNAIWAFGRLGSRVPLYGPLNSVVSSKHIRRLMDDIVKLRGLSADALVEIAMIARQCDDRFRDLDATSRQRFLKFLKDNKAQKNTIEFVEKYIPISNADKDVVFGEGLPSGLRLE